MMCCCDNRRLTKSRMGKSTRLKRLLWLCLCSFLIECAAFYTQSRIANVNSCRLYSTRSNLVNKNVMQLEENRIFSLIPGKLQSDQVTKSQLVRSKIDDLPPLLPYLRNAGPFKSKNGLVFAIAIIFILALSTGDSQDIVTLIGNNLFLEGLGKPALENIRDTVVPSSSTEIVAIALGESFGGILAALVTAGLAFFFKQRNTNSAREMRRRPKFVTQATADSNFFIVNSAVDPLLSSVGVPSAFASAASALFASIPSELVKFNSRQKENRLEEDRLMQQLLEEEQERKRRKIKLPGIFQPQEKTVNLDNLVPAIETEIDFVEIFADAARWLEFDILTTNFAGQMTLNGEHLHPALDAALLGAIAATSSQLYADVLYGTFSYGPNERQFAVRSRKFGDWALSYASIVIYSGSLFGIYQWSQIPVFRYIQGMLAGGVDGCIGSTSFDMCMQTYIDDNAPGSSSEAQLQALSTNLGIVAERLQDIVVDTSYADFEALFRAWCVSAVSYFHLI